MAAKSVFKVLLLLSIVMSSLCYVYIIPGSMGKSKDHEDYCFHNESQTLIKRGESAALKEPCEEAACGRDYTISVYGCGSYEIDDPSCLKWTRDHSKPYPICCQTFVCVEPAKDEVTQDEIVNNYLD